MVLVDFLFFGLTKRAFRDYIFALFSIGFLSKSRF